MMKTASHLAIVLPLVMASGLLAFGGPPSAPRTLSLTEGGRLRLASMEAERRGLQRPLNEGEILARLAQLRVRHDPWYGLVRELGSVGGRQALDYLRAERTRVDNDPRRAIDGAITVIEYRQLPADQKERFVLDVLGDERHPAFYWAVKEAGELGVKEALPRLSALIAKASRGGLAHEVPFLLTQQKITALTRYGRPLAYFMASMCKGDGENPHVHRGCQFKIWGIKKLGTVQDPAIIKYLQSALRETEQEFNEFWRQLSLTVGLVRIEDKSHLTLYYIAIYESLKSLGVDPGPRSNRMTIDY